MSDIKISETARKAAASSFDGMPMEDMVRRDYEPFVQRQIQLAINEACKPLVEALDKCCKLHCNCLTASNDHLESCICYPYFRVIAIYRKEHGP